MLHAICEFAEQKGISAEPGFKTKRVRWLLSFNNVGKFTGVVPQTTPGENDARGRLFQRCPDLSQPEIKAGGLGCRHFLVDSLEVVALLTKDDEANAKLRVKHRYFTDLVRQAGKKVPELASFISLADALDDGATLVAIRGALTSGGHAAKPTDAATFAIPTGSSHEARPVVELENWHNWWREFRANLGQKRRAGKRPTKSSKSKTAPSVPLYMRCLLTGELVVPAATHEKIEGLSDVGGLPMGDSLVSFKQPSFCSFGLKQSANAAMSEEVVATYRQTLNHLILNQSRKLAGAKVVYWYVGDREPSQQEDLIASVFAGVDFGDADVKENAESGIESARTEAQAHGSARKMLEAILTGTRPRLARCRYRALTLSANLGRVVVRDWMEGQFEQLAENVVRWFGAVEISRVTGNGSANIPRLELLMTCTLPERKRDQKYKDWVKPIGSVGESLWRASVGGGLLSQSAAMRALLQHRNAVVNGEVAAALDPDGDNRPLRLATLYARLGLLKAYLNLNQPLENCQMEPILKEDHPSAVYQFGRLVAVFADLQREALRKESGETVKSSVVDRYYIAASTTPRLRFNQLVSLSNHHIRKLEQSESTQGAARAIRNRIADIHGRIDDALLPTTTKLDEQCLFALGYYQQIARMNADLARAAAAKRSQATDTK